MKYVRTKEKIYTDDNLYTVTKVDCDSKFKVGDKLLSNNEVFAKIEEKDIANTIEELCDEFVQITKSKDKDLVRIKKIDGVIYYQKLERAFDSEWHRLSAGEYIIGSIWTDKGLIYVAKTNEKGEFELL